MLSQQELQQKYKKKNYNQQVSLESHHQKNQRGQKSNYKNMHRYSKDEFKTIIS
jgi:hypothetical protein